MQPLVQSPVDAESRPVPRRSRLGPWVARLPYLAFLLLMLYKQRAALQMAGLGAGEGMAEATLGALLFLLPWLFLRRGRVQLVAALLADIVLTLIAFADVLYFRHFGDLTSVATLRFAGQLSDVSSSVTELLQPGDLRFWLDIPVLFLAAVMPSGWAKRILGGCWEAFRTVRLRLPAALAIALAGAGLTACVALNDPFLGAKWTGHTSVATRLGLVNYHLFDLGSYGSRLAARMAPAGAVQQEVQAWFSQHGSQESSPLFGAARGRNVIVLQLESFQAFTLGLSVEGQEITPNLNRLARESLSFTEAYHQTGQGVTSDADLLGNCSLYPTRTGAVYYDYAGNNFRCMPEILREQGYTAVAMQGIRPDFWNLAAVYPQVGFERYFSELDFDTSEQIGIGLADDSFLQQAVDKLKSLAEPYYAYLVTLTSHGPFDFEGLPHSLNLGDLEGTQVGHYLQAVHYTDQAVGRFLERLKEEGILENAVLAVYGDHTGVNRNSTGFTELLGLQDEVALHRAENRVPLMIRLPGGAEAGDRTQPVGQADLAPTLAALLGIPPQDTYFMGRNLLADEQGGAVPFYTGSALNEQYLFLTDDGEDRCFDRQTGEQVDAGQCQPLAEEAAEGLHISREIVERDLIPDLMANDAE